MVNKEAIKLWVDSLRSGKYRQGYGFLRTCENNFCCLGVLCDLAVKNNIPLEQRLSGNSLYYYYDDFYGDLPDAVKKWVGLENIMVPYEGKPRHLWSLNDSENLTFGQIADLIEQKWLSD